MDIHNRKKVHAYLVEELNAKGSLPKSTIINQTLKTLGLVEDYDNRNAVLEEWRALVGHEGEYLEDQYRDVIVKSPKFIRDSSKTFSDKVKQILSKNTFLVIGGVILILGLIFGYKGHDGSFLTYLKDNISVILGLAIALLQLAK